MRKRYTDKVSYYKLLDELNSLPDGCQTDVFYIRKIFDKKLEFIDCYINFTKFDSNEEISAVIMFKSCNIRISRLSRLAHEFRLTYADFTNFCFNSKILTIEDFIFAANANDPFFRSALDLVQHYDNEAFVLIQT